MGCMRNVVGVRLGGKVMEWMGREGEVVCCVV